MGNIVRLLSTPALLWFSIYPYAKAWDFFARLIPASHNHEYLWASLLLPQFLAAAAIGPIIGALTALFYGRAHLPMSILFTAPTLFALINTGFSTSNTVMRWVLLGYQVFSYAALLVGTAVITRRSVLLGLTGRSTGTSLLRSAAR